MLKDKTIFPLRPLRPPRLISSPRLRLFSVGVVRYDAACMKVLFLTKYDVQKFGIAEPLSALSAALGELGVDVTVYSSDPSARCGHMTNGQPCIYGPIPRPHLFLGGLASRHIARLCKREGFELIHCHGLYRPGWAARAVKRLANIPYVVTSWGDIVPTSSRQQRWSVRRRCRAILASAAAVVHPTAVIAGYSRALGACPGAELVIPNGIDLARWRKTQAACDDRRLIAGRYILAVGKLVAQKGFHVLIRAMALLARQGSDVRLVIAGDGPDKDVLQSLTRELGLHLCQGDALRDAPAGSVCMTGFVDFATKVHLYRDAAAVAFSSQHGEGFPGVLLEAMAAGKAIIASDILATRAIVTQDNALFVPPADAAAWARAITDLLNEPARLALIEKTNSAVVEDYAWSHIARRFAEVYKSILSK